jgi:DNA-binding response OmpR family regulator
MSIQYSSKNIDPSGTKRVLIVEDEPSASEASRLFLSRRGFEVETAANADEAIQLAMQYKPDVVVCDWQLGGGKTGVDVARELQSKNGVTVIFVTAYPLDELRDATTDIRVLRYMRKPISLTTLAETIESIA